MWHRSQWTEEQEEARADVSSSLSLRHVLLPLPPPPASLFLSLRLGSLFFSNLDAQPTDLQPLSLCLASFQDRLSFLFPVWSKSAELFPAFAAVKASSFFPYYPATRPGRPPLLLLTLLRLLLSVGACPLFFSRKSSPRPRLVSSLSLALSSSLIFRLSFRIETLFTSAPPNQRSLQENRSSRRHAWRKDPKLQRDTRRRRRGKASFEGLSLFCISSFFSTSSLSPEETRREDENSLCLLSVTSSPPTASLSFSLSVSIFFS